MGEIKYLPQKVILEQDNLLAEFLLLISEQEEEILQLRQKIKSLKQNLRSGKTTTY